VGWDLSPLGTSVIIWPILPAPNDRWVWSIWLNENWQGKPKYFEKTCPSAILSTTNPTWSDLRSNLGHRGGKPATNRLIPYLTVCQRKNYNLLCLLHVSRWYLAWLILRPSLLYWDDTDRNYPLHKLFCRPRIPNLILSVPSNSIRNIYCLMTI
jgi:hypothetical protein